MSRATLRRIQRLTAEAAPAIAELARRREFKSEKGKWAQSHLLALVAISRYGEPRIVEPLHDAYERALKALPEATHGRLPTYAYWPLAQEMCFGRNRASTDTAPQEADARSSAAMPKRAHHVFLFRSMGPIWLKRA